MAEEDRGSGGAMADSWAASGKRSGWGRELSSAVSDGFLQGLFAARGSGNVLKAVSASGTRRCLDDWTWGRGRGGAAGSGDSGRWGGAGCGQWGGRVRRGAAVVGRGGGQGPGRVDPVASAPCGTVRTFSARLGASHLIAATVAAALLLQLVSGGILSLMPRPHFGLQVDVGNRRPRSCARGYLCSARHP